MANGVIFYRGPSQLNSQPILGVATGFAPEYSANIKTGPMIQTWILSALSHPADAIKNGDDTSVCGDCPLRRAGCYVLMSKAPHQIWQSLLHQKYQDRTPRWIAEMAKLSGQGIRVGAYGDPCAIPLDIWQEMILRAPFWTGYTHQWADLRFLDYRKYFMASVETELQMRTANRMGWRCFIPVLEGDEIPTGFISQTSPFVGRSIQCLADASKRKEGGKIYNCSTCQKCNGASVNRMTQETRIGQIENIWVTAHGGIIQKRQITKTLRLIQDHERTIIKPSLASSPEQEPSTCP